MKLPPTDNMPWTQQPLFLLRQLDKDQNNKAITKQYGLKKTRFHPAYNKILCEPIRQLLESNTVHTCLRLEHPRILYKKEADLCFHYQQHQPINRYILWCLQGASSLKGLFVEHSTYLLSPSSCPTGGSLIVLCFCLLLQGMEEATPSMSPPT